MLKVSKVVAGSGLTYIIGAFGFVTALAWNDAIKGLIDKFFHSDNNLISKFIYAFIVTLIAVVATVRLTRVQESFKEE